MKILSPEVSAKPVLNTRGKSNSKWVNTKEPKYNTMYQSIDPSMGGQRLG